MLSDLILNHWFELDFSIFNQPVSRCKAAKHATLSSWSEATPNVTVLSDYKNQISASFIAGSLKTQAIMNINAQTHHIHAEMLFGVFSVFGASLSQDVSDVTGVPLRSEHVWRRESLGALCNAVVDRVESSCTKAAKNLSVHGSIPHSTAGCRLRFSWIMHYLPPHGGCRSARRKSSHFCQAFVAILSRLCAILTDMSALVLRTPQEILFTDRLMERSDWNH